jgi:hypothetical protein
LSGRSLIAGCGGSSNSKLSCAAAAQTTIDNLNQQVKAAQDASNAAKAGNQPAYAAAAAQLDSLGQQRKAAGSQLGAKNCA